MDIRVYRNWWISIKSQRVREDPDQNEEPLQISRSGSTVIVVPALEEIVVPAALTQQPPSFPPSNLPPSPPTFPSSPTIPQTPASTQFRHINVAQKRTSDVSYSVGGAGLRMKRRRLEAISSIPQETELLRRFPARIRKEEYLEFLGLSTSSKLSLDQGKFVRDKRLAELGLRMSRETPGDGSCMFHALLDQIKSNPSLPDYAENHWELRYKLVFEGCDKVIDKLHWPMRTALDLIKNQAIARGSMPGCQLTLL